MQSETTNIGEVQQQEPAVEQPKSFDEMSYEEQLAFLSQEDSLSEIDETAPQEEPVEDTEEIDTAMTEEEEEEEEEEESPINLYTVEEFKNILPEEVDPERLPGAAREVHKRYMDIYNRDIVPELQQLRAFYQKTMSAHREQQQEQSPREAFMKEVNARALRELGVNELDEFNAEHLAEISRQSSLLTFEQTERMRQAQEAKARQQRVIDLQGELEREIPNFREVDRWAEEEMKNLPYSVALKIQSDMESGDIGKIRSVMKMFAERYQKHKSKTPPVKKDVPPKVLGGSTQKNAAGNWDYQAFAGADSGTQARMLIEAGLVDD